LKLAEDDFLASCVAISLVKLAFKTKKTMNLKKFNKMVVDSSLIICALTKNPKMQGDDSSHSREQDSGKQAGSSSNNEGARRTGSNNLFCS